MSRIGTTRRYGYVAMSRSILPFVAPAGVGHFLTQVTVHLPTTDLDESAKTPKSMRPTRASLKLPDVCHATQSDIEQMPVPSPAWSIDAHDRMLAKMFRDVLSKRGLKPTRIMP